MRDFKFRKWHKELEDMTFWDGSKGSNNLFWHTLTEYPDMYHLMQYTGLKDKNGVEIYEGDVCRYILDTEPFEDELDLSNLKELKGVVEYHKCYFHLTGLEYKPTLSNYCINEIEVIGNIYSNPELLK